jgi:hypothetical protein
MPPWQPRSPTVTNRGPNEIGTQRLIDPALAAQYSIPLVGWNWWVPRMDDIKGEGWKLHVSGNENNAAELYRRVLPVLQQNRVAHKIMVHMNEINRQTGEQAGKILVIYPDDLAQAFAAVGYVDQALTGWNHYSSPAVVGEQRVGNTVVYARYGAFIDKVFEPTTRQFVDDTRGALKPSWIENPWQYYPHANAAASIATWPQHQGAQVGRRR